VSGKIQAPRGTFDVLGEDALARDRLEQIARGILEPAGYERIETPMFESTSLFARFRSRQQSTYGDKMLSAMRFGFGGHVETSKK